MGKKLAIKGHSIRGKEIIGILEMLGGTNVFDKKCNATGLICYLDVKNHISEMQINDYNPCFDYMIFTLEGFLEKYPIKVGDKVKDLKSDKIAEVYKMHWSENNSCVYYDIKYPNNHGCQRRLMDLKPVDDVNDIHSISECKTIGQGTYAIKIADGYKFDSIDENGNIIVKSFKRKPIYPTTYKGCCDVLHIPPYYNLWYHTYEPGYAEFTTSNELLSIQDKLNILGKLLICRGAYWKIAGEEMGLDKPWEPDWKSGEQKKYCIYCGASIIQKGSWCNYNSILAFPTEEMRDIFHENFKELIEQCKELF